MSQFADDFGEAGFDDLANMYGETVSFTPRLGTARSILAIVHRRMPQPFPGSGAMGNVIDVWIKNHATEGATSIDIGGAKIELPPRIGDAAEPYRISEIVEQDHGMWHIQLPVNG